MAKNTRKGQSNNQPAPDQSGGSEPTFEEVIASAATDINEGKATVEEVVSAVMENWDVTEEDIQEALKPLLTTTPDPAAEKEAAEAAKKAAEEEAEKAAAEAAKKGPKTTVTVTVPKRFKLTRDDHTVKEFFPGVQEMEPEEAEHWWAKSNGVTVYQPK